MLSGSDFASSTTVLQALLAALGAVMAWRGARLSGDHKRRHSIAWGAASVVIFLLALLVGALGNHESAKSLKEATERAEKVQGALEALRGQNSTLIGAMEKIAGKAEINPNQSAQALADQVIKKLSDFQNELDETKSSVYLLQNPPPDPDYLYQKERVVAKFWNGRYLPGQNKFVFMEISSAESIDFLIPIYFRGLELRCDQQNLFAGSEMTSHGMINNSMHNVVCSIISGEIIGLTNPPAAWPLPPAPLELPAGK